MPRQALNCAPMIAAPLALALAAFALAAHASPPWQAFARCAAAYQVNAGVADPDRPAAMRAQVSDTAQDYRRAAVAARRPAKGAAAAVDAEIARRAAELAPRPREAVEKLIDACPQLPETP